MKSYTDLEQSRKLAEILSLESADMWYGNGDPNKISVGKWNDDEHDEDDIPCWSLMALLSVIPKCIGDYNIFRIDINDIDTSIWYDKIEYGVCNELPDITMEEPVDACVEMIMLLKDKDLL